MFFHIGLHKTGSTWFQRHLFPNLAGVSCLRTRHIAEIVKSGARAPILIVSHESLSGTLSSEKQPGDNKKRLTETLGSIAAVAPGAPIIIGFREHGSWLSAAYAQKAKKQGVKLKRYVATFSREDLSWCRSLDLIEDGRRSVFPFLYEELSCAPEALVDDLCRFLGTEIPANLPELLAVRENASPRSKAGQILSRPFFQTSYALRSFTSLNTKSLREFGGRLGTRLDQHFAPLEIGLDQDMAQDLRRDWKRLLERIGNRRSRDLSALSPRGEAVE
ncbi:hypothetical protein [Methyloceanibacter sp.]|uniref:hypothetical protein n=1 Tax=Methyloceanibacter sp. TaxID=1965321 RepID=UPI003D6CB31B